MRRLLSWLRVRRSAVPALAGASYADALNAGWMPAPPPIAGDAASTTSARAESDVDGLVARFYRHQEC